MIIDNEVDDIKAMLLGCGSDETSPHSQQVVSGCCCQTCQQLTNRTASKGRVPSTCNKSATEINGHVPSLTDQTVVETNAQVSLSFTEVNGQAPLPTSSTVIDTNGQLPQQTCLPASETNGQVPSNTHLSSTEISESVLSSTCQTATQTNDQISDSNGQLPQLSTSRTVKYNPRCHPLCSCDQCLQVVSSDVVDTHPDVYCRNERGFSGQLKFLILVYLCFRPVLSP